DGKLEPGDIVTAIDGKPITTFYDLSRIVEQNPGRDLRFSLKRGDTTLEQTVTPVRAIKERPLERSEEVGRVGVMSQHPVAVIGLISPGSPASSAGLRTFDIVVAAAGRPIRRFIDLETALGNNQGSLVPVSYLRPTP